MTKQEAGPFGPWIPDWLKKNRKPEKIEQPQIPLPEDDPNKMPDPKNDPGTEKPNKIIKINPDGTVTEE